MKYILYLVSAFFAVGASLSFGLSMYAVFVLHDNGSAALHIIFTFTNAIMSAITYGYAKNI